MLTVLAFLVALGLLIAVHEYGHYRMAVACGVKVLRFSIGMGRVLWSWQPAGSETEFVLCAFPIGGYVRMLDEREAPVAANETHRAFNNRPLRERAAIVAAGPLANLLLAVLLLAAVNWAGVRVPAPVLASPVASSMAAQAGLQGGERVLRAGFDGEELQDIDSYEDVRWWLTRGALEQHDVRMAVAAAGREHELVLPLAGMGVAEVDASLFRRIGLAGPRSQALIGQVMPDGAAQQAGLQEGDLVLAIDAQEVRDGAHLREIIRAAVPAQGSQATIERWHILRDGRALVLTVQPDVVSEGDRLVGRIGAMVGAAPQMETVHYGPFDGVWRAAVRTWDISALTLRTMGRMVIGQSTLKNLSGPLTIADYAGRSASMGLTAYLSFLALISVSLGVLNLLPLPMLDGGHLMYYFWEAVTGRGITDVWQERLQRGGLTVLALMMAVALFNDLVRLLG